MKVVVQEIQLSILPDDHKVDEILEDFRFVQVQHLLDDDFVEVNHAVESVSAKRRQKVLKVEDCWMEEQKVKD